MPGKNLHAAWTSGEAYERWVGRWSRPIARQFVPWLHVPAGASWLDVGCGTGVVTDAILTWAEPECVVGVDRSATFRDEAARGPQSERASFEVGDAAELPYEDGRFDVAVAGLVLNFLPDPGAGVREMTRVVRRGGTLGAYVWDYLEGMEIMRAFWDVAAGADSSVADLPEVQRYPLCRPDPLRNLFTDAGLRAVEVTALEAPAVFRDFDDYWQPFLGGQGTAPTYVASLSHEDRTRLREGLRATFSPSDDGHIEMRVRAWAVRGTNA